MIRKPNPASGSLARRLLLAFSAVAVSSVLVLTAAALIGTDRGLAAADRTTRANAAAATAVATATAYRTVDGWVGADFGEARTIAQAAGAQLTIRDASGVMVWPGRAPAGSGPGHNSQSADRTTSATVTIDGRDVGTVSLTFATAGSSGRSVAWLWVAGAAVVAILMALAMSRFVARRLAAPIQAMTRAARAFAAGDRQARAAVMAPGEIGDLAVALAAMADQVVRAEHTRRQLSADVAHELRTPLAALQAGLEELRDGMVDAEPARLAALHDQSLRLGRVVADLADLAAAESSALSLRLADIDLADVASSAVDGHEAALRSAGLRVRREISSPVLVRADADRLHQAVGNLLANTVRYCRPGDEVAVQVWAQDGRAYVQVADTGSGIDAADVPHVFDRLWRGRGSDTISGAGIGLAVVRELVAAHGGTVTVRSSPGEGATFTIQLPAVHRAQRRRTG